MRRPVPQGESCEGGEVLIPWEVSSMGWRSAWMEDELWCSEGECSNQLAEGKLENNPRPWAPQHEGLFCQCQWELNAEIQASDVRLREKTRIGCTDTAQRRWTVATEDVLGRSLGPPERQAVITGGQEGEGCDRRKNVFPYECSQTRGHHVQEQTQIAITTVGSRVSLGLPLQGPQAGPRHCFCCPRSAQRAATPGRPTSKHQAPPPLPQDYSDHSHPQETCKQAPSPAPAIPGMCKGHCTCTPHVKGIRLAHTENRDSKHLNSKKQPLDSGKDGRVPGLELSSSHKHQTHN